MPMQAEERENEKKTKGGTSEKLGPGHVFCFTVRIPQGGDFV